MIKRSLPRCPRGSKCTPGLCAFSTRNCPLGEMGAPAALSPPRSGPAGRGARGAPERTRRAPRLSRGNFQPVSPRLSQPHNSPIWLEPTRSVCSLLFLLNCLVRSEDHWQIEPRVSGGFARQSAGGTGPPAQISLRLPFVIASLNVPRALLRSSPFYSSHFSVAQINLPKLAEACSTLPGEGGGKDRQTVCGRTIESGLAAPPRDDVHIR